MTAALISDGKVVHEITQVKQLAKPLGPAQRWCLVGVSA